MTKSTKPTNQPNPAGAPLSVVGLGASAGGLGALSAFFDAIPDDTGMTFVVITHLAPDHESIMAELLQAHTAMPVRQVSGSVKMEPNQVYVIPPGKRLVVTEGHLDLAEYEMPRGRRLQIDTFFRTLAEHHGDGAAIILSGTGSDGAVGIQHIKERGGLILAQEPAEAEYNAMPQSAIATGLVDIIAPVAELATGLVAAKQTRAQLNLPTEPAQLTSAAQETLTQILDYVYQQTGHNFAGYRREPLLQRIGRRMQLAGQQTLSGYLQQLRGDEREVAALYHDLVIHLTEFFRDEAAWSALANQVIPELFVGKGRGDTIRVWTVGCAHGEEAYSIAILLLEHAATLDHPPQIQIFASDLGKPALDFARQGIYPEAIAASVSEERLERFFAHENNHYRVRQPLRDRVLFASHNLLQDPPFGWLDLIICRNILGSLQQAVQEQVYAAFHYALDQTTGKHGYLFLGARDMAQEQPAAIQSGDHVLFEALAGTQPLYRRCAQEIVAPRYPLQPANAQQSATGQNAGHAEQLARAHGPTGQQPNHGEMHRLLLEELAPPSLLVDDRYHVLHLSESVGRFLRVPGGALTRDVTRLAPMELQQELQRALAHAFTTGQDVYTQPVLVQLDGTIQPVALLIQPSRQQGRALILFFTGERTEIAHLPLAASPDEVGGELGGERTSEGAAGEEKTAAALIIRRLRQRLAAFDFGHAALVEELRTANAELQSTNEEYRALLSELEVNKEELRSTNEELRTVNDELTQKAQQSSETYTDLQNFLSATEIGALYLDRELCVVRYTAHAAELFNLIPSDRGRPIGQLRPNLHYPDLVLDANRVLADLTPLTRDVQCADGRWYLVSLRPYRTLHERIEGVVITLVDITANKQIELALRDAKVYDESIVQTIPDALLVLSPDLRVQRVNEAFYTIFQVDAAETEGRLVYELGNNQWDIPALRTLLEEILPDNQIFTGYEVTHTFESIGRRTMLLNGRRLEQSQLILLAITDITERKVAEEALQASEERYRLLVESAQEYAIFMLDPVGRITSWNTGAERIFGYREAEALGQLGAVIFTAEDRAAGAPEVEMATARYEGQASDDRWHVRRDGSRFWANGVMEVLRHQDGSLRGFAKVLRDNTKPKAAADALAESRQRYQQALEAAQLGTWRYDVETDTNHFDERSQAIFGLDRATYTAAEIDPLIHPDDLATVVQARNAALEPKSDGACHYVHRVIHPDGAVRWIRLNCQVTFAGEGAERRPVHAVGVIADVTERREAANVLRASEERYRTLFESIDEGFCIIEVLFDENGQANDYRFLTVNPAFARHTGLHDAVGKRMRELEPNHEEQWFAIYGQIARSGEPQRFTNEERFLDERWYDVYAFRVGEPAEHRVAVLFHDISARVRAEQALRQLNETLEARVTQRSQQVRELVMQLSMSEQEERHRISQVLHDDLQQRLYSLQFQLMLLRGNLDELTTAASSPDEFSGGMATAITPIDAMEQEVRNAIGITRSLSVELSPPVLEGEGLVEAIGWLATQMQEKQGLTVRVQGTQSLPIPQTNLRVLLFQTIRETLFNIVKHAAVAEAEVWLSHTDHELRIEIIDHGGGFDVDATLGDLSQSHGLRQNQRRLELVGGHMEIESSPARGTRVILTCPLVRGEQ